MAREERASSSALTYFSALNVAMMSPAWTRSPSLCITAETTPATPAGPAAQPTSAAPADAAAIPAQPDQAKTHFIG